VTEETAITTLNSLIKPALDSHEIKVVKRDFSTNFQYVATLAVLAKDINIEVITVLAQYIRDGNDFFSLQSTTIDLRTFESEVLLIDVEIDLEII